MFQFSRWSMAGAALVTTGLTAGTILPLLPSTVVSASPNTGAAFSDTQNHWAQPFIQRLTERQILAGYPDGTFRPDGFVRRDEYAAILRQAFNQAAERRIPSASVYKDIPQGYWAAPAIEEAYEMGFLRGYPGGFFGPDRDISRTEVLVSLAKNMNLRDAQSARTPATASQGTTPQTSAAVQPANRQPNAQGNTQQPIRRQSNRRPFAIPMAMTSLMQPFVTPRTLANLAAPIAQAQTAAPAAGNAAPAATAQAPASQAPTAQAPQATAAQPQPPASTAVTSIYADANQIPPYAVDAVAQSTRAGIVVNYPEPNLLNPNRPATRAEVAAFVHQALVDQGRLEPLPNQNEAANFVVKPE